jgi:hypothetical protein
VRSGEYLPQQPGAADGEASFLLGALSEHDPAVINPLATLQDLLLRERDTDLRPDALDERIIEDIEAAESFGEERESPEPVEEPVFTLPTAWGRGVVGAQWSKTSP